MTDLSSPPAAMTIAVVSDVVCPWCVIGLGALDQALDRLHGRVAATVSLHPFELNPDMARAGENVAEHIARKYGRPPGEGSAIRDEIKRRAADVGFAMNTSSDSRIWNTFDCHRLLHWAGIKGRQRALKQALFTAHFSEGRDMGDHGVLAECAFAAGLDAVAAAEVLASGAYAAEVRAEEAYWRREGINAVPTFIINGKYAISGGQSADVFERALGRIAAEG
jgi:predicted DsbA family dithiol-disulfide isomerase